ncbi:hypothetical protein TNCV_403921 [Trichonephila clavipes]|nr:hypothetical protein TNCV_403921 [Trichonephila clavipes]
MTTLSRSAMLSSERFMSVPKGIPVSCRKARLAEQLNIWNLASSYHDSCRSFDRFRAILYTIPSDAVVAQWSRSRTCGWRVMISSLVPLKTRHAEGVVAHEICRDSNSPSVWCGR